MSGLRSWALVASAVAVAVAAVPADAGPRAFGPSEVLYGMSAVSPTDGWAVGSYATVGQPKTVALHWNGRSWTRVPTPSPRSDFAFLTAASMVSARDAWAVGPGIILHWDGTTWTDVPSSIASDYLTGVSAATSTDAWAVGHAGLVATTKAVILHWDGASWTPVKVPDAGPTSTLTAVSAVSSTDVWAVGSSGPSNGRLSGSKTFAVHWDGTSWKRVSVPSPAPGAKLFGVSARSGADVWAVGDVGDNTTNAMIVHWNGRSWKSVKTPRPAQGESELLAVSASSPRSAWAVGSSGGSRTMTMHWDGRAWTLVRTPSPGGPGTGALLAGVSAGSAGGTWAVGDYGTTDGGAKVLILRSVGRSWKVF